MNNKLSVALMVGLVLTVASPVWADAPSKNLVAIKISTGGAEFDGFTAWADDEPWQFLGLQLGDRPASDPCSNGWHSAGCLNDADILKLLKKKNHLYFFTEVNWIKHPKEALVTTVKPEHLPVSEIKSIALRDHKLNGHRWYGPIMKLEPKDVAHLQKPPLYQCQVYGSQYPMYWMSYTKRYGAEELKEVCEQELTVENKTRIMAVTDKLEADPELILLNFPWD